MSLDVLAPLDFQIPAGSAVGTPPEREGRRRDSVSMMVADTASGTIDHARFTRIGEILRPGDVLVLNVSAAVPAALDGVSDQGDVRLHMSSPIAGSIWTAEPRRRSGVGSVPWRDFGGGVVALPGGAEAVLLTPDTRSPRLWITEMKGIGDALDYLRRHGHPIRYGHTSAAWPISDYQTVYAREPGSAEMPSAGRPFTTGLLTSLMASGVQLAPLVLHCGVASFESGELPDAERYRIPETTARVVNQARAAGGRAIAVGTTTVRAIETMTDSDGLLHPGAGVTDLIVTPQRGVAGVDGMMTGWHEAGSSHLQLVEAVAGRTMVERCYAEAVTAGYQWHEFGDSLLVLRDR